MVATSHLPFVVDMEEATPVELAVAKVESATLNTNWLIEKVVTSITNDERAVYLRRLEMACAQEAEKRKALFDLREER